MGGATFFLCVSTGTEGVVFAFVQDTTDEKDGEKETEKEMDKEKEKK